MSIRRREIGASESYLRLCFTDSYIRTAPIILITVLAVVSAIYVARIWARLFVAKNAGLDDVLMTVAMFPLFGLTAAVVLGM